MTINEYKAALKNMIDATDDEALLKHWKNHLEPEFEKYKQQHSDESQNSSATKPTSKKDDDNDDYVVLESGLGIDE